MAINRAGGPNFQQQISRAVMQDVNTVDAKEASHAAQTGAAGKLAEKNKANKKESTKPATNLKSQLTLSDAAKKAQEQEAAQDADQAARDNVKDEAAVQNRSKRGLKGGDDDDKKIRPGKVQAKESRRVLPLDDDSGETYEVTETQGKKLDTLDGRTPESILSGMPEGARKASEATLDTQIKTKGKDKVAEFKEDPKVTRIAEEMDLDLADPEWKASAGKPAPIAFSKKPLEPTIDEHQEKMAKDAVQRKMMNGEADEAMIA